ncbi:MAG TPA: hypothetical protein VFL81_00700 [Candidatus Saccharimonadales bacterium]|nr:hypothetical protein [Candidatus Saccharimonadales bacterium]
MENVPIFLIIILALALVAIGVLLWLLFGAQGLLNKPKLHDLSIADLEKKKAEFQAELREQGLMDLEKAVSENAAFIQKDVRRTATELNGYMHQELQRALDEEFSEYHRAADQINQLVAESLKKVRGSIDEQHRQLSQQMLAELAAEKQRLIEQFQDNMAEVVGFYVKAAIGDSLTIDDQLDYILAQLENNKQAIAEDLKNGG